MASLISSPRSRHLYRNYPLILYLLGALLALTSVTACGVAAVPTLEPTPAPLPTTVSLPTLTPQPTDVGLPTATPLPTVVGLPTITPDGPGQPRLVEEPAPVESVAIEVAVTDPPQADLVLTTGLPNACYSFGAYDLSQEKEAIRVRVTNVRPDDTNLMCAQVYGMVTTRIPLGPGIEPCAVYQVIVNGRSFAVQALGPNIRCGEPSAGSSTQVEVGIGKTVPIGRNGLALTFLTVSEDSRCPSDVVCIWAGRGTISVNLRQDGVNLGDFDLTLGEGAASPVIEQEGYSIRLTALEPYPNSTRPTSADQYLAILTVSKS